MDKKDRARRVIRARTRGGDGGTMPCPCCVHGSLRYRVSRTGHISATCSTPGCVSWVEGPPS